MLCAAVRRLERLSLGFPSRLAFVLLLTSAGVLLAQTDVRDVVYTPSGQVFVGLIKIRPDGVTGSGANLPTIITSIDDGLLSVKLHAITANPEPTYSVSFKTSDGSEEWTQIWKIPAGAHLYLSDVCVSNCHSAQKHLAQDSKAVSLPLSVADIAGLNQALTNANSSLSTLTVQVNGLASSVASLSSTTLVKGETPAGSLNGSNAVFTLSETPTTTGSLKLSLNGQRQVAGVDYTLAGTTITFASASVPQSGDTLCADYLAMGTSKAIKTSFLRDISLPIPISDVSGLNADLSAINSSLSNLGTTIASLNTSVGAIDSSVSIFGETPSGSINGMNLSFTLEHLPAGVISVFKNGVRQQLGTDYTVSGATISFAASSIPQQGDTLLADYSTSSH